MGSHSLSALLVLLTSIDSINSKRTYIFKVHVAYVYFPSTSDQLYFRLCHSTVCSTFTSLPNGLPSAATEYEWSITTPIDYGSINKIQIVHTGNDHLCLNYIDIDSIIYVARAPFATWCFASNINGDSKACTTLTVTSANDWSDRTTEPCEYASLFNVTYPPTPSPTNWTHIPTTDPTKLPTMHPTMHPTLSPTYNPTSAPTLAPFPSANVAPITTTYDVNPERDGRVDSSNSTIYVTSDHWMLIGIIFASLFLGLFFAFMIYCHHSKSRLKKEINKTNIAAPNHKNIVYHPVVENVQPGAAFDDQNQIGNVASVWICDNSADDMQDEGQRNAVQNNNNELSEWSDSDGLYDPGPEESDHRKTSDTAGKSPSDGMMLSTYSQ